MAAPTQVTAASLFREIVLLLKTLDRIEHGMIEIYSQRLVSAAKFDTQELLALAKREEMLQAELRQVHPKRADILRSANRIGLKPSDVKSLLKSLAAHANPQGGIKLDQYTDAVAWLKRQEIQCQDLKQQVWTNLQLIQRSQVALDEMRSMFCAPSKASVATGAAPTPQRSGGVLLDARV